MALDLDSGVHSKAGSMGAIDHLQLRCTIHTTSPTTTAPSKMVNQWDLFMAARLCILNSEGQRVRYRPTAAIIRIVTEPLLHCCTHRMTVASLGRARQAAKQV
jgi:hypothetical protein